uniref:Uncharacterized protein n=1 Tax=Felis catus TaxID=9685 RepID=A0ABI7Z174_FELCA
MFLKTIPGGGVGWFHLHIGFCCLKTQLLGLGVWLAPILESAQVNLVSSCRGTAPGSGEDEGAARRASAVRSRGDAGTQVFAVIGVWQRQAAAEHLPEHPAELLRGHVVQERVDDRAQVEESVGEGEEDHVRPEVGLCPVVLGFGCGHNPPHLIRHPADSQGHNNQP